MSADLEGNRARLPKPPPFRSIARRITHGIRVFSPKGSILVPVAAPHDRLPQLPGVPPTAHRAGADAEIWKTYVSEATDVDKNIIASWNEDLDVLLIFAGLFSAVLTAFIVENRKDIQEDYQKTSAELLRVLVNQSLSVTTNLPETFHPTASALSVNTLWFTSLGFSLTSALWAMLSKQWVRRYASALSSGGSHLLRARRHQSVLVSTRRWHLSDVISMIPIFMHIALFLFLIGLVIFIWGHGAVIFGIVTPICVVCLLLYIFITILPAVFTDCPFRTPFSFFLPNLFSEIPGDADEPDHSRSELDVRSLAWLMSHSTTTSVVRSAAMAISGLEGTVSQQKILYNDGAVDMVANAIASCTVEERGSLIIRHDALDAASLLLFSAQRLLSTDTSLLPQPGLDKLTSLLTRFDPESFLDIRLNFDSADFAAALWCIHAYCSLRKLLVHTSPHSNHSVAELVKRLPVTFSTPATRRIHQGVLRPVIQLAYSSADDVELMLWAVQAMIQCWKFEGYPLLGETARHIFSLAATTTMKLQDGTVKSVLSLTLAQYPSNTLVPQGIISSLLTALKSGPEEITNSAVDGLEIISKTVRPYNLAADGAIRPLIEAAFNSRQDEIANRVMSILATIAGDEAGLDVLIAAGGIAEVVKKLKSGRDIGVKQMEPFLNTIVRSKSGLKAFIAAGGAEALVGELQSEHDTVAELSKSILLEIVSIQATLPAGAMEALVNAFVSGHDGIASLASCILELIICNSVGLDALVAAGGFEALASILRTGKESVTNRTHGLLLSIRRNSASLDAFITAGGVEALVESVSSEQTVVAVWAVRILDNITGVGSGLRAFITAGGIKALAEALQPRRTSVAKAVMSILYAIIKKDGVVDACASTSVISPLIDILFHDEIYSSTLTIAILQDITANTAGLDAFVAAGASKTLLAQVKSQHSQKVHTAAKALEILMATREVLDIFISLGAVGTLLEAIYSGQKESVWAGSKILSKIAEENKYLDVILSAGTIPALIEAVQSKQNHAISAALDVFQAIINQEAGLHAVIRARAVGPLVNVLRYEHSIAEKVMGILPVFATTQEGVDSIVYSGGVELLVMVAESENIDMVRQAKEIIRTMKRFR